MRTLSPRAISWIKVFEFAEKKSAASFISLGLFITNYTKIQSTTILAGLLLIIPMMFLSGIIIPLELMSPQIQAASSFQPLTIGTMVMSEIMLKGTSIFALGGELLKLLMPAIVFFGFTLLNKNL